MVAILKSTSIIILTEPDTPLSNAYHVGSFNFPQITSLHSSLAGVRLPPGIVILSCHAISKVFAFHCKNFHFSEVYAIHVTNLYFPDVYNLLVLSQSCDIDNDIDSIYDIYIVVNVPAKAQARRKLVLPPGLSILLHHRSPSDIHLSSVVHGHNLPHRPPQALSVCITPYS